MDRRGSAPMVSEDRPYWGPRQVRTLRGVRPGAVLMRRSRLAGSYGGQQVFVVVRGPYSRDHDLGWVDIVYLDGGVNRDYQFSLSLGDFGVVPYPGGAWNQTNYLERAGRRHRFSDGEVCSLLTSPGAVCEEEGR